MGTKILIVDDSPTVGSAVAWGLTHHGYQVRVVRDASEALAMLADFSPGLIILDVRMPSAWGIRLCGMIREQSDYHSVPVIMLSGPSDDGAIESAIAAGCDDHITKPVSDEKLRSVIEMHLARSGIL